MEYGSRSNDEQFDPAKYWKDKMEGLTSGEMSDVSGRRAKLREEVSKQINGRPPALTSSMIDTLMERYPTEREIEFWINSSSSKGDPVINNERLGQAQNDMTKKHLTEESSKTIQTPDDELLRKIKKAADVFEQSGGWKRYGGGDD